MSAFQFIPAKREQVGLIIGVMGASGSGKTYSAMRLASGMSMGKRFAVIDTENKRGLHYADAFAFDHCDLREPFRPEAYMDAIVAADKAGYPVILVDSASHEWSGDGGVLDWQEEELTRMAGDDWKKRETCKMASWIRPKGSHKKMMSKLLQVNAHVILAFRAEEKIEMVKEDGKWKVVPKKSSVGLDGWMPICEKNMPYELTASFLLLPSAPGVPHPIKLQAQHRPMVPLDKPITEETGKALAEWAAGGTPRQAPPPPVVSAEDEAQRKRLLGYIDEAPDMDDLKMNYDSALQYAKTQGDTTFKAQVVKAKDARKRQLEAQ